MTTTLIRRRAPMLKSALSRFDDLPRWLVWRNEPREDDPTKLTKIPYQPSGRKASITAPTTWVTRAKASAAVKTIVNGQGGGIGIVLGELDDDTMLTGVDLDSCRREDGTFESWAQAIIERFRTYTEISPSGNGAKLFFSVRVATFEAIKDLLGTSKTGKQFKRAGGSDHPPGFEIYFLGRYFAVTEQHLAGTPDELATIEVDDLSWLLTEAGPALTGNGAGQKAAERSSDPKDQSRSGAAFRLGMRMRQAGGSYGEFCDACRSSPDTRDWYQEKGIVNGERELHRIWDKAESDGLPTIQLVAGERPQITIDAIDALERAAPPLYRRGLSIVNVAMIPAKASDGANIVTRAIVAVPGSQLAHELGKAAHWLKYDRRRKVWTPADVPSDIATRIAALPNEWRFKPLAGIVATQTIRPDGSILDKPGYDEATGFLLFDPPEMPPIPEMPRRRDAYMALNLLDHRLDEFPFAFDAEKYSHAKNPSRSVALSMLMTPVLRPALTPAVPLLVVQKPSGGSGGSYLCDLASALATGERCPVLTKAPNAEETEKRLIGAALDGQPIVSIDNCNGELRSEFLCQAIERPLLKVRALGSSELIRIANSVSYFANGNNIQIAADLVRRTLQCRLDANMERPETREFQRPTGRHPGRQGTLRCGRADDRQGLRRRHAGQTGAVHELRPVVRPGARIADLARARRPSRDDRRPRRRRSRDERARGGVPGHRRRDGRS